MTRVALMCTALFVVVACSTGGLATPVGGDQTLYVENRGGPAFDVYINDSLVASVGCGRNDSVDAGAHPLPWDLAILRTSDKSWTFNEHVTELPRWLVQLGTGAPGLSRLPVLGPVITCPPDATTVPPPGTPDPYAGLPSNACGGFHLKIVNELSRPVRVAMGTGWSIVVDAQTTRTIVPLFESPRPGPEPWDVLITDNSTAQSLFRSTMVSPVDQKVTLTEAGATQAPYDLMAEGC